jgi:hypothetical protein
LCCCFSENRGEEKEQNDERSMLDQILNHNRRERDPYNLKKEPRKQRTRKENQNIIKASSKRESKPKSDHNSKKDINKQPKLR